MKIKIRERKVYCNLCKGDIDVLESGHRGDEERTKGKTDENKHNGSSDVMQASVESENQRKRQEAMSAFAGLKRSNAR